MIKTQSLERKHFTVGQMGESECYEHDSEASLQLQAVNTFQEEAEQGVIRDRDRERESDKVREIRCCLHLKLG